MDSAESISELPEIEITMCAGVAHIRARIHRGWKRSSYVAAAAT